MFGWRDADDFQLDGCAAPVVDGEDGVSEVDVVDGYDNADYADVSDRVIKVEVYMLPCS